MAFPNLYYKRTAATAKACYICYKPTTTVLATIDTSDFLYTCPVHLTDRGFATRAPEPDATKPSAGPEEIAKVKQEWEEKQREKKDKEKEKEKKDGHVDDDGNKGVEGKDSAKADGSRAEDSKQAATPTGALSSEAPTSKLTHERYVLHRNIFALRTTDHRRRRQAAQAKVLAPLLPTAPKSSLP